jgi:hypothetical protein
VAQKTIVQLVDDLDGTQIADGEGSTVHFGLQGTEYEIDLSDSNFQKLQDALDEFVKSARIVSRSRGTGAARTSRRSSGSGTDTTAIRQWAKDTGLAVSERGRISAEISEAYNKAH